MINLRLNYTRLDETHPSPSAGFDVTSLGFPAYLAGKSQFVQLPRISFGNCGSDSTQATSFDCLGQTGADLLPSDSLSLFGTAVLQWRSHVFKFGVDARRYQLNAQTFGASIGSFTFGGFGTSNGWTQSASNAAPAPFGQDFASFLLGLPTSGQFDLNASGAYSSNYYALFVQDDWRIKRNLTINLGLRYRPGYALRGKIRPNGERFCLQHQEPGCRRRYRSLQRQNRRENALHDQFCRARRIDLCDAGGRRGLSNQHAYGEPANRICLVTRHFQRPDRDPRRFRFVRPADRDVEPESERRILFVSDPDAGGLQPDHAVSGAEPPAVADGQSEQSLSEWLPGSGRFFRGPDDLPGAECRLLQSGDEEPLLGAVDPGDPAAVHARPCLWKSPTSATMPCACRCR